MELRRLRRIAASGLTVLALLLAAGCRVSGGAPRAESGAPESTIPTEPGTEASGTAAAAAEASTEPGGESEPPVRIYTEADLHCYLQGQGAPVEGLVNVVFCPDSRGSDGTPDPDIQVRDSYRIRNREEITRICELILASEYYDPALYGRSLASMVTEWEAHNDVNALYDNERTRHVDFNRADEGVSYLEFWQRAAAAYQAQNP